MTIIQNFGINFGSSGVTEKTKDTIRVPKSRVSEMEKMKSYPVQFRKRFLWKYSLALWYIFYVAGGLYTIRFCTRSLNGKSSI